MALFIYVPYGIGHTLHLMSSANLAVKSDRNQLRSLAEYLSARWMPILCRTALNVAAFIIVWNNPDWLDLQSMQKTLQMQFAIAFILGWFSDSAMDKLVAMLPWIGKDSLPQLNGRLDGKAPDNDI